MQIIQFAEKNSSESHLEPLNLLHVKRAKSTIESRNTRNQLRCAPLHSVRYTTHRFMCNLLNLAHRSFRVGLQNTHIRSNQAVHRMQSTLMPPEPHTHAYARVHSSHFHFNCSLQCPAMFDFLLHLCICVLQYIWCRPTNHHPTHTHVTVSKQCACV